MPPNSVPQEVERQKKPGVQRIPSSHAGVGVGVGPGSLAAAEDASRFETAGREEEIRFSEPCWPRR